MVTDLRGISYEKRLAELGMVTLDFRVTIPSSLQSLERGDLIQAYKVLSGKDRVDASKWFSFAQPREVGATTRALTGRLNVIRNEGRTEIRRNFWSVRVCDQWNSLPDQVKEQETTNGFKNALDNFMFGQQR